VRRPAAKGPLALLIVIAVLAGTAAGAFAYWGGPGSGSATTVLADTQSLSFTPGTPTAELYPGDDASVAIIVSNPNPYFIQIGSIVLDTGGGPAFAVDAAHSGCDISVLNFVPQDNEGAGWRIPPRAGTTDGTLAIDMAAAMRMSAAAANACQGATFTVALEGRS
jgi:hypothetical protein